MKLFLKSDWRSCGMCCFGDMTNVCGVGDDGGVGLYSERMVSNCARFLVACELAEGTGEAACASGAPLVVHVTYHFGLVRLERCRG